MELRVLRYFLAVAREKNITNAATALHITQPTLSRQIHDLEKQLGQKLFIRNSHSVSLTPEGMLLRKRAEEILDLVQKTEKELSPSVETLSGDLYIGAGETRGVHYLTRAARRLQSQYPEIRFHIFSGDRVDVSERLDKGLIDFGLLFDPIDFDKYHSRRLPYQDKWGVLMRKDSPLAEKSCICPGDLLGLPLIFSRQSLNSPLWKNWFGNLRDTIHVAGTYNLAFNGSLMVADGMGYALCLDRIIDISGDSPLCFRPLNPGLSASMYLVWKKYQVFSKAAEKYLAILLEEPLLY